VTITTSFEFLKLKMHWLGPYQITWVLGIGTFTLATLDGIALPKTINGFRLKPYFGPIPQEDIMLENPIFEELVVNVITLAIRSVLSFFSIN